MFRCAQHDRTESRFFRRSVSSRAAFALHVLFDSHGIEIEADDLAIERLPLNQK